MMAEGNVMASDSAVAAIARDLREELRPLRFGEPVSHVYQPLDYAWEAHAAYLDRYAGRGAHTLLVGMNPGPWGMAQTGVPFGEVTAVRDWMGIRAPIGRPAPEHPKRPVLGLACARSEVSGRRIWGWAREHWGTPERFFGDLFVYNFCPLLFLEPSGRNFTPDKLPKSQAQPMLAACDRALRRVVEVLRPRRVVGVGRFAETRARRALVGLDVKLGCILHPSPASPKANVDWERQVAEQLASMGVELPAPGGLAVSPSRSRR